MIYRIFGDTMEALIQKYRSLLTSIRPGFKRELSNRINWNLRAICIEGARGTGKSTLMLQQIKEFDDLEKTLYTSLDDLYFKQHSLVDVGEQFYLSGGRNLYLDEVHKYENWQTSIKNLYDFYPDLKLIVSGSSIIELQRSNADLSRRLVRYHLPELSFREYLGLKHGLAFPVYSIDEIVQSHVKISGEIIAKLPSPLATFNDYLSYGAYPFFMEGENEYFTRINQLINVIIDYDLPEAKAIEISTQAKLKRLLYIISQSVPFKPNIAKLAGQLGTSRIRLLEMLHILEETQLIRNLRSSVQGISLMNKPDKIFLRNPSLIYALAEGKPEKGNLRETFFFGQLQNSGLTITHPDKGDFKCGDYIFEIGGKNKTKEQIHDILNSFVASDGIEHGWQKKIPLWLFGFLY